ncbi:MAG: hypothetical protein KAG97_09220, partial [Victivallales bacterium]|nr:hypothetical protein [Victivallales bacterium]
PSGSDWRVYVFCQREALQWDGFNRLDVLNSESIKYFLKETHEKYAERFSKYFGNVIPGIMTDEYKFLSGAWTEKLTKLYMDRHKNDLIELLPALVDDSIPESKVVRNNYHRLVNDLFLENYTVPMKKWCSDNNLILTGHISPEEHATVEVKCAGNIAAHIAHFDMPGCDIIIQAVGDREHPDLNLSPRLAASVARQQGISKVFVEAGACSEENLSIESLKHLIDWLMVHGINFINIHGFSYSLSGYHKFLAGQTLDPYGNLLTHFKNLSEYVEERCETLTEFRPVAKIAVLKPLTALRTLIKICDSNEPQSEFIDKALTDISMELIENHLEFDLLDEDGAENWRIETNSLQVGKCAYEVVIIPECGHLSESAHTQLASFAKNGGTVIAHASVPDFISTSAITTVADNTIFRIATTAEESAKLAAENCKSGITVSGPDARSVHMFKGENASGEKLCFMVNISSDSPASITIEADGETLNLKLAPRESRMIPLPFANISKKANREIRETLTPLGDWKISTKNVNHFPLESGMTIEIESGAVVESLVCDKANIAELRDTLKINGKTLDWESAESAKFYTVDNALLPVGEHFNIGRNNVQFDAEAMPTLLIAGDFSVSEKEDNRMVLKKKIESAANVSRIDSGFAFLRGELVFETRFTIPESIEGAQLRFVDRTGSIKVELDGEEKGIVAWSPDILDIGDLAAGEHSVRLKVVGAGIGLFHSGFFEAGCSGIEIWY